MGGILCFYNNQGTTFKSNRVMEFSSASTGSVEQTLKSDNMTNEESRTMMNDNNKSHHQRPQPMERRRPTSAALVVEPLHLREETIVLQRRASVNGMFCESVNAIPEMFSL